MKKRGFGKGKWNGFGGKVEKGEDIENAATRETQEECCSVPKNVEKFGVLDFEFFFNKEWNQQVHFFKATDYESEPKETDEMKPSWFSFDEIPYDSMWPDDKYWLPLMLKGKKFKGRIVFGKNNSILKNRIKEAHNF